MNATWIKLTVVLLMVQAWAITRPSGVSAQGPIASGETLAGTISPIGDSDTWTFSATSGDGIVIRVGEITQSGSFTPRIRLFDPSATLVGTSFGAVAGEIAVTAASSGTFSVIVDDAVGTTATGTYRITLAETGSAVTVSPGDQGGALTNGAMHTGTVDVGDLDVWTVVATAGDAIVVRMGEIVAASTLTPWVRIYSPAGTQLASSFGGAAAEVSATAAASGTYVVVVGDGTSGLGGSGTYRLTLAKSGSAVTVSPGDQGGAMTNGAMHTGTVDVGDLDVWTVVATAGDAIVVRMGEMVPASTLTPWVRIYSPTGTQLASSFSGAAAEVSATAAASGTYVVVVGDGTSGLGGSGTYRLTLAKTGSAVTVSSGDEGGVLTNGAMRSGTVDVGDLDVWTVAASAGNAIVVRMGEMVAGSTLTPWVRIYSPTGTQLGSSFSGAAAEVSATAATSGSYVVVVGDGTSGLGGSGTYRLTLAKTGSAVTVSPGDQGGALTNGTMHTGTVDVGDLDVWTIAASAGNVIVVRMGEMVPASTLTPWVRIYSPTGTQLGSSFSGAAAEVSATAATSGTYVVVVGDGTSGLGGSGTYRLTLGRTGSLVVVSPGDEGGPMGLGTSTGTIDVGDLDVWTLNASAGENVMVTMEEVVAGSPLTPYLRVYSPAGVLLGGPFGPSTVQVSVTGPVSGVYLVVVGDGSSGLGNSGAYRLTRAATTDVSGTLPPMELALGRVTPNPFVTRTILRYDLPLAGAASLRVFDAQGRLVRTLVDDSAQAAGQYQAVWDGRDNAGVELSPGLYLARLDSGGRRVTQKLMLSR